MTFLYILIGLFVGGLGIYLLLRPKLQVTAKKNIAIEQENQQLALENQNLLEIHAHREELINNADKECCALDAKRQQLKQNLEDLKDTQRKAAEDFYNQALSIAENGYEKEIDRISDDLSQRREEVENIYLQITKEAVQEYQETIAAQQRKLNYLTTQIEIKQIDVNLAVEAAQRKLEMETKQDYYRICLSDEDIAEIKRLREVLPYLRDKTPLNKVIYKVYYERPLTDMIGRVVGPGVHTGIYKITNINNQMCYVGQAANIADRWKQHCKRGVGAEDWTQNKLYPAMYALGVENFTFEIVEECDRSKLNEREDYWQNYFHAKDFGYSIK